MERGDRRRGREVLSARGDRSAAASPVTVAELAALQGPLRLELVTGRAGFSRVIEAPRIQELAVACAYLTDAEDPARAIGDCAEAYQTCAPMPIEELELLGDLVCTRWAITVLITEWRARLQPHNATYILRNNAAARRGLALFDGPAQHRLAERLKDSTS